MEKRFFAAILVIALILTGGALTAVAEDVPAGNPTFSLSSTINGVANISSIDVGDEITFSTVLKRTDSDEDYKMYSFQDEIVYDPEFFYYSDTTLTMTPGFAKGYRERYDGTAQIQINYVDFTGRGVSRVAVLPYGSFKLVALKAGKTEIYHHNIKITNADVSLRDVVVAPAHKITIGEPEPFGAEPEGMKLFAFEAPSTGGGYTLEGTTLYYSEKHGKYLAFLPRSMKNLDAIAALVADETPCTSIIAGDVTGDGEIDTLDAILAFRLYNTGDPFSQHASVTQRFSSDYTADLVLDVRDAQTIVNSYLASLAP